MEEQLLWQVLTEKGGISRLGALAFPMLNTEAERSIARSPGKKRKHARFSTRKERLSRYWPSGRNPLEQRRAIGGFRGSMKEDLPNDSCPKKGRATHGSGKGGKLIVVT